ncbi:MAG: hypothetical protein ACRCTZ_01820 [Sarcina sp.]
MVEDKFPFLIGRELDIKLPQIFKEKQNTSIRDFLECIKEEFNDMQKALVDVENLADFDNNHGYQLDLLGANIKEDRIGEDDKYYRNRIKLLTYSSNSLGDENTIINGLSKYLDIDTNEIYTSIIDTRKIKVRFEDKLPDLIKTSRILKRIKAAGIRLVTSHRYQYKNTQNYSYANFVVDSLEFTQDVRKFREIKNETNYSYFIPYNENVEFEQSTLKFKEFKAITNYNYITTTHENIEYIQ